MNVEVNWLAIVLATVASMVVGALWYGPLFGKEWRSLAKLGAKYEPTPQALGIAFVTALFMAYVLAHVTFLSNRYFGNSWMMDALMTGFWMWAGFQATRMVMRDAFEGRRKKLTLINTGNDLATIMAMALVIGLMKL